MKESQSKLSGFLLIGHGSRREEANQALFDFVQTLKNRLNLTNIEMAFFSLAEPDIPTIIDSMVKNGCRKIIAQPFFLFNGNHTKVDLPKLLEECASKYNGIEITLLNPLGGDKGIIHLIEERLIDNFAPYSLIDQPKDIDIEKESMDFIEKRLSCYHYNTDYKEVIKRVIHTTTDFDYIDSLKFHPDSIKVALQILSKGCKIITDVKMVAAGIRKRDGDEIICMIDSQEIKDYAGTNSMTRAAASMEKLIPVMDDSIIVIGNSPTALARVIDIIKSGKALPKLIIGVPVGFVGALDVKIRLTELDIPYITNIDRKGGSTVAVSIINALMLNASDSVCNKSIV